MTDNLPAPFKLIELNICNCKRGCSTLRCKCFKNSLVCTDMCKCSACNNTNTFEDNSQEILEYIESDVEDLYLALVSRCYLASLLCKPLLECLELV